MGRERTFVAGKTAALLALLLVGSCGGGDAKRGQRTVVLVTVDTQGPSSGLVVNGGRAVTTSRSVMLDLDATDPSPGIPANSYRTVAAHLDFHRSSISALCSRLRRTPALRR